MAMKSRNRLLLVKIETTLGVEVIPSASTDAVKVENLQIKPRVNQITTNEHSGSLDGSAPIPGGTVVSITGKFYLKGVPSVGTVGPEWGDILKIGGFAETLQAAAVGAPTAIASGTTTTATLTAPFAATADLYRHLPIFFSGTPASAQSAIWNYTVGRVASLTDTFGSALTVAALAQIPANALYTPITASIPSATCHVYIDGKRWRVVGCRAARLDFSLEASGVMACDFEISGILAATAADDTAMPVATFDNQPNKPIWRNQTGAVTGPGAFTFNSVAAAPKTFSLSMGLQLAYPENPNNTEGFDPPEVIGRSISGSADPFATLTATRDLFAVLRAGTLAPVHGRGGNVAGNRISLTLPQAQITDYDQADRNGIVTDPISFFATGIDAQTFGLCVY